MLSKVDSLRPRYEENRMRALERQRMLREARRDIDKINWDDWTVSPDEMRRRASIMMRKAAIAEASAGLDQIDWSWDAPSASMSRPKYQRKPYTGLGASDAFGLQRNIGYRRPLESMSLGVRKRSNVYRPMKRGRGSLGAMSAPYAKRMMEIVQETAPQPLFAAGAPQFTRVDDVVAAAPTVLEARAAADQAEIDAMTADMSAIDFNDW